MVVAPSAGCAAASHTPTQTKRRARTRKWEGGSGSARGGTGRPSGNRQQPRRVCAVHSAPSALANMATLDAGRPSASQQRFGFRRPNHGAPTMTWALLESTS
ncbi:hypothetical protein MRX96_056308 [Rhipicephalus microplus]